MSDKRRDHKGRVLKTGESQREDLRYQFRYKDAKGKRQTIYSMDLRELRAKEEEVLNAAKAGIDYAVGQITVLELVERYTSLKCGVRYNTKVGYNFVLGVLRKEDFGYRMINAIKTSDAQLWLIKLQKDGRGYSTIQSVRGVLKPAFQMAYNEDVIRKNPFDFKLSDVVVNDSQHRVSLTPEQLHTWMEFIRTDRTYKKYYDEFVVLLGTGMRVSEFCGLTSSDIDFDNKRIRVDHQLVRERGGKYYVEKTKTEAGRRFIPMTPEVYESLKHIVDNRKSLKVEHVIDGYTGFILLDKDNNPKVALHIENEMRWAMHKYKLLHPDEPLPHITPHVFRHTFCTNMAMAGMNVKGLQYLMGHSDAEVTMNVYTHASYDFAADELTRIVQFLRGKNAERTGTTA